MDGSHPDAVTIPEAVGPNEVSRASPPSETTNVLGLRCWDIDIARAARYLVESAQSGQRRCIFFVNAHCVNVAARDVAYANLLSGAPFVFADGVGMAMASRLGGRRLRHNVNGTDLFPKFCEAAAAAGVPLALLGASPGVAEMCANEMRRRFPGLRIVWVQHGYLTEAEEDAQIAALNASGAKVLLVAKGVPTQELWIARNAGRLDAPVLIGVGALFDFYSGTIRRAPGLLRALRIEWLYRLALEPRRMFSRYVLGNPAFLARALRWRTASRRFPDRGRASS
jgi:exopolysaccharide biosynthesis WecB/TagA/CpsF family protein